MTSAAELTTRDGEHLRMLSIAHYLMGAGLFIVGVCFIACVPLGYAMLSGAFEHTSDPPPPMVGWAFIGLGLFGCLSFWIFSGLLVVTGRFIRARRRRIFCIVVAVITCTGFQPLGPVLGVLSIAVLMRPTVRAAFDRTDAPRTSVAP